MMDKFFVDPQALQRLHAGPLGSYIDRFAALLSERGYARSYAKQQIRLVANLSQWLCQRHFEIGDLDEQRIAQFLQYRRRHGRVRRGDTATLRRLLEQLRQDGVIRTPAPAINDSEVHRIESTFAQYLLQERGLSGATLVNYLPFVRRFLSRRFGTGSISLEELRPLDVTRFVLHCAQTLSRSRAKLMVTALRSFFHFLRFRGDVTRDLVASVPTVANWRLSGIPNSLEPGQVERLLKSCDQTAPIGQRDYTILLLLVRLGLRAGEVVNMELDDIGWEAGELTIRGKGNRMDRLPLPPDVGEALATYLRYGRPHCPTRRVFIRMEAPLQGFATSVAICNVVGRALTRAGLCPVRKGAHLLRHSMATQMLRKGASLKEIGEILRHRRLNTTEIYTKVDLSALRTLAQPWPGGAA